MAVAGVTLLVLLAWGLKVRRRRQAEKQQVKGAWATRFDSEMEAMATWKLDETQRLLLKQAEHLERDCDCATNHKVWGYIDGGPIKWEVHQSADETLGIVIPGSEVHRLFPDPEDLFFEHLGESLCAAEAPHYWMAIENPAAAYDMLDDASIVVPRPSYLSRSTRKPKTKVEVS